MGDAGRGVGGRRDLRRGGHDERRAAAGPRVWASSRCSQGGGGVGRGIVNAGGREEWSSLMPPGPCPGLLAPPSAMSPACGGRTSTRGRTAICRRCAITCPLWAECVPSSATRAAVPARTTRGSWPPVGPCARPLIVDAGRWDARAARCASVIHATLSSCSRAQTWRARRRWPRASPAIRRRVPRSRLCQLVAGGVARGCSVCTAADSARPHAPGPGPACPATGARIPLSDALSRAPPRSRRRAVSGGGPCLTP